ncbi:MAG: LptF/LptG family permease [Elusimicrobiota bacterium]|nr:LptF/LptG family permease [Elusimicrobiota bacterium]
MKILYFYISKKFLKIFCFAVLGLMLTVFVSEAFFRAGFYLEYKVSLGNIIIHLITRVPWQTIPAFPIATLLALLFSLGDLSQKNEVTAMKAAGINIKRIVFLFIIIGFFIGLLDWGAREFIVPRSTYLHETIDKKLRNQTIKIISQFADFIISPDKNIRISAKFLDVQQNYMENIIIEHYDGNFHIQKLLIAERAVWENGTWQLINGVERLFENNLWKQETQVFSKYDSQIRLDPKDLSFEETRFASMTSKELKRYINQLNLFGNPALKARIELNLRYAMIFCHIIVMMAGIPFALSISNKTGKIISFTLALFCAFLFWGAQALSQSMAQNNIISPFMSAWLPNFIFITAGIFMLNKTRT